MNASQPAADLVAAVDADAIMRKKTRAGTVHQNSRRIVIARPARVVDRFF
jgi:hypothetical protein